MGADSLGSLLKDRKVQIGVAVAGGVGLLVLMRRGGGAASGGGGAQPQTVIQPAAAYNSSASDLANTLQDIGQTYQQNLQQFTQQLGNINDKLSQYPTGGTGTPAPATPVYADVKAGWNRDQWIHDIDLGQAYPGVNNLTLDKLQQLNPDLAANLYADNNLGGMVRFTRAAKVRIQ